MSQNSTPKKGLQNNYTYIGIILVRLKLSIYSTIQIIERVSLFPTNISTVETRAESQSFIKPLQCLADTPFLSYQSLENAGSSSDLTCFSAAISKGTTSVQWWFQTNKRIQTDHDCRSRSTFQTNASAQHSWRDFCQLHRRDPSISFCLSVMVV